MPKLEIKAEKLADRCEICHQKDLYSPTDNYCDRCKTILVKDTNKSVSGKKLVSPFSWIKEILLLIASFISGGVIGGIALGALFFVTALCFPNEEAICPDGRNPYFIGFVGLYLGIMLGSFLAFIIRIVFFISNFRKKYI